MIKLVSLCVLILSAQALTDREILQEGLNGVFDQNKLAHPTTIIACINSDALAKKTVDFIGTSLEKAAKGSIGDLISLIASLKQFIAELPPEVSACLTANQEVITLGALYGITPDTEAADIEKKAATYITLHYLQVHKWFGTLNDEWKGAKYYQTGFDGANYAHSILGLTIHELQRMLRFH